MATQSIHTINTSISTRSSINFFTMVKATIIKDLLITTRYRANLIGGILEMLILTASFFVFSVVLNLRDQTLFAEEVPPNALFLFFLAGIMVLVFQNTALYVPLNTVNRDLYNGTLEYLYSNPISRYGYFLGTMIADIIVRQVFFIPLLAIYLFMRWNPVILYIIPILLILFLTVSFIGVTLAQSALIWKRVTNIVGIFQILIQFVGGLFVPVQSLPPWIIWIAYFLPFTFALDLVRYYSFGGNWNPVLPIGAEWALLFLNLLLYYLLSQLASKKAENHAKTQGLNLL